MSKHKKRKPAQQQPAKVKPENYIRERARKLPVHECLINEGWQEGGIAMVVVSRRRANGNLVVGTYVVDIFCLGVKDTAYYYDIDEYDYREILAFLNRASQLEPCSPQLAFNVVYGAVEYAEEIGFRPHRDFRVTEFLLDEEVESMDIEFGKDGQPYYFAGPHDNVNAVMNTLRRTVGEGNFHYVLPVSLGHGLSQNGNGTLPDDAAFKALIQGRYERYNERQLMALIAQMSAMNMLHEELEGDYSALEDVYDEEFLDTIADRVVEELDEDHKAKAGEDFQPLTPEERDMVGLYVEVFMDRIAEHGDIGFFFAEDYDPLPEMPSLAEIESGDKETQQQAILKMIKAAPKSRRDELMVRAVFGSLISKSLGEDDTLPQFSEKDKKNLVADLRSGIEKSSPGALSKFSDDDLREILDSILDKWLNDSAG